MKIVTEQHYTDVLAKFTRAVQFTVRHFPAISEYEDFKKFDLDFLKFLLSSHDMTEDEGTKCKALMTWVDNDSNRAESLLSLMQGINLNDVPLSYRMHLLKNEEKVFNNVECVRYILESISSTEGITPCDFSFAGKLGLVLFDTTTMKLQKFCIEDRSWSEMQALDPSMNHNCSAVTIDHYLYAIVWNGSLHRIKYKDENANWEKMASPNMMCGVAVALEGSIYTADHANYNDGIEKYNPSQNTWSVLPAKRLSVYGAAIAAARRTLYVIGGYNGGAKSEVESFGLLSSQWDDIAPTNVSRYNASAVATDKSLYLFGGYNNSGKYESSVELYPLNSNAWEIVNLSNFARLSFSSWACCKKIYLIGGNQRGHKTIEEFDPTTKILTKIVELDDFSIGYYSSVPIMM